MERIFNLVKKGIKWYLEKSADSYYWTSTGFIPMKRQPFH